MDYARSLLAYHFPLFAQVLRTGNDVKPLYLAWADNASWQQMMKFQLYYSAAYPEQYKANNLARGPCTEKDMETITNDYFKQMKKVNDDNEKVIERAMRSLKAGREFRL